MNKTLKSIYSFARIMGFGSLILMAAGVGSVINIINAVTGYNMEMLDGFWSVVTVMMCAIMMVLVPVAIAMSYMNQYRLLTAMPMAMGTVPAQMSLLTDLVYIIIVVIDMIAMLIAGIYEGALLKLSTTLGLYIISHIALYISARTAAKSYGTAGKVVSGLLCFLGYGFGGAFTMISSAMIYEEYDVIEGQYGILLAVLAGMAVLAAVTRIVSYKGIVNCVRQIKIYKGTAKKKQVREEQYV